VHYAIYIYIYSPWLLNFRIEKKHPVKIFIKLYPVCSNNYVCDSIWKHLYCLSYFMYPDEPPSMDWAAYCALRKNVGAVKPSSESYTITILISSPSARQRYQTRYSTALTANTRTPVHSPHLVSCANAREYRYTGGMWDDLTFAGRTAIVLFSLPLLWRHSSHVRAYADRDGSDIVTVITIKPWADVWECTRIS